MGGRRSASIWLPEPACRVAEERKGKEHKEWRQKSEGRVGRTKPEGKEQQEEKRWGDKPDGPPSRVN